MCVIWVPAPDENSIIRNIIRICGVISKIKQGSKVGAYGDHRQSEVHNPKKVMCFSNTIRTLALDSAVEVEDEA